MESMVKRGHIDGIKAELDWLASDELAVGGRLELNAHTWQTLDPADESDRKLIDRFEEGTW